MIKSAILESLALAAIVFTVAIVGDAMFSGALEGVLYAVLEATFEAGVIGYAFYVWRKHVDAFTVENQIRWSTIVMRNLEIKDHLSVIALRHGDESTARHIGEIEKLLELGLPTAAEQLEITSRIAAASEKK